MPVVTIEEHPKLKSLAGLIIHRPVFVIACCMSITLVLAYVAATTPADLSFTGLLNQTEPEVKLFRNQLETFGASSMVVLLLEGEPEELGKAIDLLMEELPKRSPVAGMTPPADPQWFMDRAPWLWPDALYERVMTEAVKESPDPAVLQTVTAADTLITKALRPTDKAALISMELQGGPLDMAMGGDDYLIIERETHALLDDSGLEVSADFTGLAALGAQDQHAVFLRVKILTPLTLIIVLILLRSVETRFTRILMAGVALGSSILISFGMVGLIQGRLSILVTFFGMLLIGLGIDFGIHLLVSLRDGRSHGLSPDKALSYGVQHTGLAIAMGGTTTALAFGVVALTPEPGARDMGLAAVFGLFAAMILMLTFLPASWLILERRHAVQADPPPRFNLPGLHASVGLSLKYPRTMLLLTCVVMAVVGTGISHYHLEGDLKRLISRDMPAMQVEERLKEIYGISPVVYSASADSLEQAREWTRELRKLPDIAQVSSAADFLLEGVEGRPNEVAALLAEYGDSTNPLIARLKSGMEKGAISLDELPPELSAGQVGANGELALRITPRDNLLDAYLLKDQIAAIRAIAPTATGMPVIVKMAVLGRRDYVPILIPAIFVAVVMILTVTFRNVKDVMLAMLPVVVGTVLAFGLYFRLGLMYNTLTGAVVPVIIGLGVDDGIHVVERLRRYKHRTSANIHEAVEGVGRAIFLTTATTVISFIGLLFTNHPGMESIAYFMLMGVPLCFVASVTVLPAAAVLMEGKSNEESEKED